MNHLGKKLINSVELSYIGDMAEAKGNLAVYLENPVGVGEHSSITTEIKMLVEKIATARDALDVISEVKRNGNY
jgi:hypothetical protein